MGGLIINYFGKLRPLQIFLKVFFNSFLYKLTYFKLFNFFYGFEILKFASFKNMIFGNLEILKAVANIFYIFYIFIYIFWDF